MQFLKILFWETVENLPLFIGFLFAVRIRTNSLAAALVSLLAGIVLGVGLIHFTETKKFSNQPTLKETLTNLVVFSVLAVPFVFYFSDVDVWWSNWMTDVLFGAVAGGLLAWGESRGWKSTTTLGTHAVAMAVSVALLLTGIRFIYRVDSLANMLLVGGLLTVFISVIISWIDYWPVKANALQNSSRPGIGP